eukprot:scaffold77553_cov46-Prasinocladus_malaysianus.AAC.2
MGEAFGAGYKTSTPSNSGKMFALRLMLSSICSTLTERAVVVSSSMKALNLIGHMCDAMGCATCSRLEYLVCQEQFWELLAEKF